ncbi:hypothetical protein X777_02705 [Ooceraea biroi]|uniref:Uncharacterized protein n=1 Tax=Ooceraea biroi TaxID=2015173 RepID=A0A026WP26_OOCBI|nr:hypothetical protein X777_02705 [Ooceraea biroi]
MKGRDCRERLTGYVKHRRNSVGHKEKREFSPSECNGESTERQHVVTIAI